MKKNKRYSGGITIVSLVITIILLLILAAISLQAITNSGLFASAHRAKTETKRAQVSEWLNLKLMEEQTYKPTGSANVIINETRENVIQYKSELEEMGKVVDIGDIETEESGGKTNTYFYVQVDNDVYKVELKSAGFLGEVGKIPPSISIESLTETSSSITVTVETKRNEGGTIEYYIKTDDEENYTLKKTTTDTSYTFSGLEQKKKYNIKVVAIASNNQTAEAKIDKILGSVPDLKDGDVTFTYKVDGQVINKETWTNKNVTVTASTSITGYTLQTSKDEVAWEDVRNQIFTQNGKIFVRLWDGTNAGNALSANVTNIDTLEPKDFTPTATSTTKSITVTASTEDDDATSASGMSGIAGYRFKLDSEEWTGYQTSGTYIWDNLTQTTSHTITVEAKDNAGNTKQGTVTIGTETVEQPAVASCTPTDWTNGNVTVTLPTKTGFTTRYTTDGTAPTKTSTEYTAPFTVSSNCVITFIYTDGTNIGQSQTANISNIDTVVPKDFTPTATSTTKSITVTATAEDGDETATSGKSGIAGYRFKLDSGNWTEYQTSGTYTWDNLKQTTSYTITVEVKDKVGNTKQGTVTKGTETVEQPTTATCTPTDWTNGNVTVALPTKTGFTTRYTTDGTPPTNTSTEYTAPFTVSSNCVITFIYTDGTNIGQSQTANISNIDTVAPKAFTPTATSTTKSITVTASAEDGDATSTSGKSGIAGYRFKLDSGNWTEYQTSGTYTWDNLKQTTNHTITVEAKDTAGNTKTGTVSKGTGTVEQPEIATCTPTTWTNGKVTVTLPTKTGFTTRYTTDGTTPTTSSTAYSAPFTVSSNCVITFIYTDGTNIGQSQTANVTNIDTTAPVISTALNSPSQGIDNISLSVGIKDANSGIGKVEWYYGTTSNPTTLASTTTVTELNGSANGPTSEEIKTCTISGLTSGTTYYFKVIVYDVAGNTITSSVISATTLNPTAENVSYTPADTTWNVENVKQALDSLYGE